IAILVVVVLSVINIFGVRTGALIQNIFTSAKVAALLGLALFGLFRGRNALALAANFHGHFWDNAGLDTLHDIGGGVLGGAYQVVDAPQVGKIFSADGLDNVTFTA